MSEQRFQLEDAVRQGDAAATLLRSDPIESFFRLNEIRLFERWRGTPAEAVAEREDIYRQTLVLSAMRMWLGDLKRTGEDAMRQLNKLMEEGQA